MKFITLSCVLMLSMSAAHSAPKAELWERWMAQDENSLKTVDHSAWDAFLKAYVKADADGINRVAYRRVGAEDSARLAFYLKDLQRVEVSRLTRAEQRAYWINLYNAQTVKLILDHYPVESIRDINISPGLFARGPWGRQLLQVEGEYLSLDDIEHRILRPIWKDPRTHYALNCASLGCPNLATRAYTPALMEGMLEDGARAYVNHPRGVLMRRGLLTVSSIYVWFRSDFGNDQALMAHLRRYARAELAQELAAKPKPDLDRYDWALNDAPEEAPALDSP